MSIMAFFLEAGLQNNELCVWAVSGQISMEEGQKFLRERGIDVEKYLESGQLMITSCTECYFAGKEPASPGIPGAWEAMYTEALSEGYGGLRIADKFTIAGEDSISSRTVQAIAKEGRKYGVGMLLVTACLRLSRNR